MVFQFWTGWIRHIFPYSSCYEQAKKALAIIYERNVRRLWKVKKVDWLETVEFKKWHDSTFPWFLLLPIYSRLSAGEVHDPEMTVNTDFLKSPKGCLLSLTSGSGNENPNKTETLFDSNYPTSFKHHGLFHYCQQRLTMEDEHPPALNRWQNSPFLPTRIVSEEAKWKVWTFTTSQR